MRLLIGVLLAVTAAGCEQKAREEGGEYATGMTWDTTTIRLASGADTIPLHVELALSPEQKTMGLMERRQLAPDEGMLFVYDSTQPPESGFWMYRTRIPLDIAFADSAGVIRSIRTMPPCETTIPEGCPAYAAGAPYRYALEVNAGYFANRRIATGSRLLIGALGAAR